MSFFRAVTGLALLVGLLSRSQWVAAQSPGAAAPAPAAAWAQQQYNQALRVHPQLYSGPEYLDYARRYSTRVGHQFFLSPEKQPGSVLYNHHHFEGLQLAYDIVLDQLVLQHATSPLSLRLINENVESFTLAGHRFIRLVPDSAAAGTLSTGYYEVLVEGPVQLLARRVKQMQKKLNQDKAYTQFFSMDKLFIRKAGVYYPVSKKSSVTRLFADRSKEVQRYVQEHKLRFRKARREADIVELTRYYGSLGPH